MTTLILTYLASVALALAFIRGASIVSNGESE
jgi:hypothetical protein